MSPAKILSLPKSRPLPVRKLRGVYRTLHDHFGYQHWWPGRTSFEVMVGAILTQNAAWTNVEKAIINLKAARLLTPAAFRNASHEKIARLIRPSGYFNIKAKRLKNFVEFIFSEYAGDLKKMFAADGERLREKLLGVNGIGPETADSILLYAAEKPFFVIDAYTRRIFTRHRLQIRLKQKGARARIRELLELDYSAWQKVFMGNLPQEVDLYNDFHAQIVALAKSFCRAREMKCSKCPLRNHL